ncbi:hypothetical protein [Flavobacterium sangjuense]|uniref:Uncharacterized protein n=1 Tax=Flavobacterium sangjuense TaxID=2518177 RepID=A0A4P7PY92_9FLAO|nr:hypothetical protein [Flavobacterium sangjuense]QBZ99103.1 hypothetical protein GS03_02625 [Flavobacterium sangjuense]
MKAAFAFLFLVIFSFKGFSQFEQPKKTISIAPISNPKGAVSPTSSKAITYPSIFDKKDKLGESVSLLKKKPEEEKSIFEKEQFASPAKVYTDKMNKQVEDGKIYDYYKKDYLLATYKCSTAIAKFALKDYGDPDGDVVRIWLNDQVIFDAITLESGYREIQLNLRNGQNLLVIEALNEGMISPNTAQFSIFNDKGEIVGNNLSGLFTNVKATIIINKVDILGQ